MMTPDPRSNSGHSRRVVVRVFLVLIAISLAAGGGWYATRPKPLAVAVAQAAIGRVETTVANTRAGSISACRRAKLAPPAGGPIENIKGREGDRVRKGRVLLTLWSDDLTARERVSREQLQTAKARVREVCEIARASARDATRARELRARNFISQEAVERAGADAGAKQARCAGAATQAAG